jgi:hypothetical protein
VCIKSARSVLTESVLTQKLRRDSVKLPFSRSANRLLQGVHSHHKNLSLAREYAARSDRVCFDS